MKAVKTYTAAIYCGYKNIDTGEKIRHEEICSVCQEYCDNIGLCVSIYPVKFIYTDGNENGCAITLINYPRFPSTQRKIKNKALKLAATVKDKANQYRVSVVCSNKTYMLE